MERRLRRDGYSTLITPERLTHQSKKERAGILFSDTLSFSL